MSTAATRLPTKPGLIRRFLRWLHVRQLRSQEKGLAQIVKALEWNTDEDRRELNRLARMGNKNLVLRHRFENERQELEDQRRQLAAVRAEIDRVECAQ